MRITAQHYLGSTCWSIAALPCLLVKGYALFMSAWLRSPYPVEVMLTLPSCLIRQLCQ